jgi:hypothetical protein
MKAIARINLKRGLMGICIPASATILFDVLNWYGQFDEKSYLEINYFVICGSFEDQFQFEVLFFDAKSNRIADLKELAINLNNKHKI